MKKSAPSAASNRISSADIRGRTIVLYVVCSLLLHSVLLAVFLMMPALAPSRRYIPSAVAVSLVSLPAQGTDSVEIPAPEKKNATPKVPVTPVVKPEPVKPVAVEPPPKPAAEVSTAPTPKAAKKKKESLKHKTFKSNKIIKDAISKIEEKIERTPQPSLEEALNRLKQQVEKESRQRPTDATGNTGRPGVVTGSPRGSGLSSAQLRGKIQVYQAEIAYQVQKNWVFSELFSGGRTDLEAVLGFKIKPDGEISDIWFDQRSGNAHLDESAYRAIVKSSPLPPLPKGVFDGGYTVGIRFGPKGIK